MLRYLSWTFKTAVVQVHRLKGDAGHFLLSHFSLHAYVCCRALSVGGTTDGWGPVEGHGDRRMVLQSSTPRPINALAASFTTPLTISYAPAYGLGLSIFWNQVR